MLQTQQSSLNYAPGKIRPPVETECRCYSCSMHRWRKSLERCENKSLKDSDTPVAWTPMPGSA